MRILLQRLVLLLGILCAGVQLSALETPPPFPMVHLTNDSTIGRIYIGPKDGMITQSTLVLVRSAVEHFIEKKPVCILLELDTPGGEVFAAERISELLKSLDVDHGIPVIAYINNWAISAGAMLAYSCRYIITAPDGVMGAATPVMITESGQSPANEKMISALRADFANKASFFGRNPLIAEAMVDPDLLLVERKGEVRELLSEEDVRRDEDEVISTKGKLLTLTADAMLSYGVAEKVLPKLPMGSHTPTSVKESFLKYVLPFSDSPEVPIETYQVDYKTECIAHLVSPYVTSFLVFVLMLSIYLELSAPGATLPGLFGAVALFLLLVASNAQESLTWFEPIVILFGAMLIVLEMLFFPTMGFLLGVGVLFLVGGVLLIVCPSIAEFSKSSEPAIPYAIGMEHALHVLSILSVGCVAAVLTIGFLMRYQVRPRLLLRWRIILDEAVPSVPKPEDSLKMGTICRVVASLRPAGRIEKDGVLYNAMSSGSFIEEGEDVVVCEIRPTGILVEKKDLLK